MLPDRRRSQNARLVSPYPAMPSTLRFHARQTEAGDIGQYETPKIWILSHSVLAWFLALLKGGIP